MRGRELRRILEREPLNYVATRQTGSHVTLDSLRWPALHLAFHDADTIPPGLVRKILMRDVGLSEEEARGLL